MLKNLIKVALVGSLIIGCELEKKTHKEARTKVHEYKVQNDGGWIYWYIIYTSNNQYYAYNSYVPVMDFSNIGFNQVNSLPSQLVNVPETNIEEIQTQNLPEEIQTQVEIEQVEVFDENFDSNDGWGSHNSGSETESGESGSESSGGDAGSSDGGSGGGDGGGGDGE